MARYFRHSDNLRFAWIALVVLLLSACSHNAPRSATAYTVKKGDTLYSIAWRHGVDYHDLARWNSIGRDFTIYPGQVLRLSGSIRAGATTSSASNQPANQSPNQLKPPPMATVIPVKWAWPVRGSSTTLTTRPNGGQGLTIMGESGQEIHSAAAGRVVYTGTGLLGYGQLVIVQHSDAYLSAYAHTKSVLVHEQDTVQMGQPIATMGEGPNGASMLYFEIRVNGRPTDPLPLLPPEP